LKSDFEFTEVLLYLKSVNRFLNISRPTLTHKNISTPGEGCIYQTTPRCSFSLPNSWLRRLVF